MKIGAVVIGILFMQISVFGQNSNTGGKYFYDTLTIMDYTTNEASERLTRLNKPLKRTFYLKSDGISYTLFKNEVAKLSKEQIKSILDNGFSLYIDKAEHRGHKNLKPSVLEVLDVNKNVVETVDLGKANAATLNRKVAKGGLIRLSGFIISVNEEKFGPITMDVEVTE